MALYTGTAWVFPEKDDFGYDTGFTITHWPSGEEDESDIEFTTHNPDTGEEYPPADWEVRQIMDYIIENFREIDKAISEDNFYNPDDF